MKDQNKLAIRNTISANEDDLNSYFVIEGFDLEENRDNEIKKFNRWM